MSFYIPPSKNVDKSFVYPFVIPAHHILKILKKVVSVEVFIIGNNATMDGIVQAVSYQWKSTYALF